MARAVWRGAISFGLVTVPVRLYPAVRRRDVRFKEVDRRTGRRLRHQRVREPAAWEPAPNELVESSEPAEGLDRGGGEAPRGRDERRAIPPRQPSPRQAEAVGREDVVHGYEIAPGRFVQVTDEDLAELAPERSKAIEVEQFVSRRDLDPVFFDSSYYAVPDGDVTRPFAVLLRAMQETNRAAVCWFVLRRRRHLAALQPRGDLMLLTTLRFADEIVPARGLTPPLPLDLEEREIETAEVLLNTLSGPWEPERYRDEYRERVLALIEQRAGAGAMVEEPEAQPPPVAAGVEDLMAALMASVEQARARRRAERGEERRRRRRRGA